MTDHSNRNSVEIFFFISLFLFFVVAFLLLEVIVGIYDQSLSTSMFYFRSPSILWGKARLDYVGFCLPFTVSVLFVYPLIRYRSGKIHWLAWIITILILIGDLLFSLFVHELRPITANGGGINWVALATVLGFVLYIISEGAQKEGAYASYIFGFLIGAISDFESLTHTSVATTYGGNGIFDADFILPFSMLIAYLLMLIVTANGESRRRNKISISENSL